jgi:hypothetical protein
MTNDTRAAFEAWAKTEGFDTIAKHHDRYGYDAPDTDYAWMGWLASRRDALEEAAKVCDKRAVLWPDEGGTPSDCAADICALGDEGVKL